MGWRYTVRAVLGVRPAWALVDGRSTGPTVGTGLACRLMEKDSIPVPLEEDIAEKADIFFVLFFCLNALLFFSKGSEKQIYVSTHKKKTNAMDTMRRGTTASRFNYVETASSWILRWFNSLHNPMRLTIPLFDGDIAQGGEFSFDSWHSVHANQYAKNRVFFELHALAMQDELTPEDVRGEDLEQRCFLGATMLHYACAHDAIRSVKALCESGADIDSEWAVPNSITDYPEFATISPWTPLQIARETSSHRVQEYLVRRAHAFCSKGCTQAARALTNKIPKDVIANVVGPMLFDFKRFQYLLRKRTEPKSIQ